MREILFRGKRLDNGQWIEGCLRQFPNGKAGICCNQMQHTVLVDPKTVGQYTGLMDMNEQKIFEGDLVQAALLTSASKLGFVWPVMPVVFSDGAFSLLDKRYNESILAELDPRITLEVKGNRHDNPDVLPKEGVWEEMARIDKFGKLIMNERKNWHDD